MVPEREIGIIRRTERSMVRSMWAVHLKDRKIANDLMLGLNETIDQFSMVSSVLCHGHLMRR